MSLLFPQFLIVSHVNQAPFLVLQLTDNKLLLPHVLLECQVLPLPFRLLVVLLTRDTLMDPITVFLVLLPQETV